jgi:hypothetical protein
MIHPAAAGCKSAHGAGRSGRGRSACECASPPLSVAHVRLVEKLLNERTPSLTVEVQTQIDCRGTRALSRGRFESCRLNEVHQGAFRVCWVHPDWRDGIVVADPKAADRATHITAVTQATATSPKRWQGPPTANADSSGEKRHEIRLPWNNQRHRFGSGGAETCQRRDMARSVKRSRERLQCARGHRARSRLIRICAGRQRKLRDARRAEAKVG